MNGKYEDDFFVLLLACFVINFKVMKTITWKNQEKGTKRVDHIHT
jgi:hypothetical protein